MLVTPKSRTLYIGTLAILFTINVDGHLLHNREIDRSFARPIGSPEPPFIASPLFVSALESQAFLLFFLLALVAPSIAKHVGHVPVAAWQSARPLWSGAWSAVFVGLAAYNTYDAVHIYANTGMSLGNLVGGVALTAIFLLARAEIVASPNQQLKPTPYRRGLP